MLSLILGLALQAPPSPDAVDVFLLTTSKSKTIGGVQAYTLVQDVPTKGSVRVTLPDGIHGYQNPASDRFEIPVRIEVGKGFKFGKVTYPKGIDYTMEGSTKPTKVYEGTFEIPFTLIASKLTQPGKVAYAAITFHYQLCSSKNCWPPASTTVKIPVTVGPPTKGSGGFAPPKKGGNL